MKTNKNSIKNINYGNICPNAYWQQFTNEKYQK